MKFELNLNKLRDVIIFPFYECNRAGRCKHCFVSKPTGEIGFLKCHPDQFSSHIRGEYLERVAEWNVKIITFLGGEPFLSAALPEMLEILKKRPFGKIEESLEIIRNLSNSKIVVYTNSTLLANKPLKELKPILELVDFLTVSIEGDRFWTERIRGRVWDSCMRTLDRVGLFSRVYEKILKAEAAKPVARSSYWYEVLCTRCGSDVLTAVVDGKARYYCPKCRRVLGESEVRNQLRDLIDTIQYLNDMDIPVEVAPFIGRAPLPREVARDFFKKLSSMKYADCLLPSYKNFIGLKITCPAGWNRLTITPDGYIHGCQWRESYIAHITWDDDLIIAEANRWVQKERSWIADECYGCELMSICRSSCRVAQDYLTCPVKEGGLEDRAIPVVVGGRTHRISRSTAIRNLKRMRNLAPGVC